MIVAKTEGTPLRVSSHHTGNRAAAVDAPHRINRAFVPNGLRCRPTRNAAIFLTAILGVLHRVAAVLAFQVFPDRFPPLPIKSLRRRISAGFAAILLDRVLAGEALAAPSANVIRQIV